MTQNTWYTVARTPDSECTGRVFFSIGESSLSFDVFIQYGNISISIVSAAVEADTVFSMRVRSYAGFCYVDVKSSREYSSSPSVSVSQTLGTLVVMPFLEAGDGKQECIVSTDAWEPAPVGETYVTIDRIEAITALKYFEDGLAIGDRDAYWVLSYGSGGVFINGNRILVTSDLNNYATQSWVLGKNYITASALTGYVNGGTYNSNTKNIELKHDSTVVAQIDATAFIKDGMVDTVVVENGYLVITFNTDSGKEPISIPLADLFDPTNYYTKSDINTLLGNYVTLNTSQEITAEKYFSSALAIPLSAPSSPTSGRTYLYAGSGAYAEEPSGGVADVFPLTITKNGSTWLTYNPGVAAGSFNLSVPTRVSELTNDTGFITSSALSGYATQSWVSANFNKYVLPTASSSTKGGVKIGSGLTMTGEVLSVTFPTVSWDNISGRPTKLSDFTDDVVSGNYLPIHGTADAALRLSGNTAYTAWGQTYWSNGVPQSISGNISSAGNITGSGLITMPSAKFSSSLIIPHAAPTGTLESGETYLYSGTGDYGETPGGGGGADVHDLTIRKNGTSLGTYNLGTAAADINIPIGWGDFTENSTHRFLTDTMISTWNAKYDKPSGGIPKTDLASDVQTSLGKADTALQSFTETDPTVPAWAKKSSLATSDVPTLAISKISGLQDALDGKQPLDADLTAIAALTGSGLLRRNSNNTWSLDTNTYLTSSDHKALTLKVGTITIGSDFNSLAAKTYTITKANLTDTIGDTTYAPYNADGYVPTTRTVNGHPLSSDVTVTKGDVGLGNVENTALSTWAGSNNITTLGTITAGVWHGTAIANAYLANSSVTINGKSVSLGGSISLNLDDIGDGTSKTWDRIVFTDTVQTITGKKTMTNVSVTDYLAVPKIAPASPVTGDIYLWADADGNYSEIPGGGGVADIYDLTLRKNGTSLGTYNLGTAAADINIPIGWADLTEDTSHKFVSQSEKDTWSAKMSKMQAIPYIVGPDSDATAGTWTGTYEGITALTEGLTIVYVPHIAGATTTTLNINGLGAKTCYYSGTSKLTTHYPVGTPILFTYYNNGWRRADYNSNTTYSAGTKALFDAGTNTSNRVWSASVLASAVAPKEHEHAWADITDAPDFITEAALDGYATESWVSANFNKYVLPIASASVLGGVKVGGGLSINASTGVLSVNTGNSGDTMLGIYDGVLGIDGTAFLTAVQGIVTSYGYATPSDISTAISALGLGTASQKDYTTSVAQNGTDLPTSGAVYSAIAAAVTSALHYRGMSSTALTDGGTETATIGGQPLVAQSGDVVIYNGFEFLWENNVWNKLGDDSSYALKTVQISAGTGLTGGGDLTTSRTIGLSTSTQTDIGKGVTAYGWGDHASAGYLPLSGGTMTGTLYARDIIPAGNSSWALGSSSVPWTGVYASEVQTGDIGVSGAVLTSLIPDDEYDLGSASSRWNLYAAEARISSLLAIPTTAPSAVTSGEVYLWASSLGEYSETPGGGGTGDIYALTITKNGSAWLSYDPGVASVSANLTIGWSDLTPDAKHRFLTDTLISTWNGKQDAISDLSTIRTNAGHGNTAYGWGDHSQAGYLTSYTETDPVFGASVAAGITSGNISTWNAKYSKPSGGIPKSDLTSAVQTSLGLADTALQSVPLATDSTIGGFKTGNVNQTYLYFDNDILKVSGSAIADYLSGEGYFDLPTWQDIQNTPTTLSGYGINDAKIANGTITLGSNSITPLTSFTETDPTVPSWAKQSSKPTYTLDEVADGSTRKLSNYLPLSGGTLTGNLVAPAVRIANTYYGISFARTTATPVETILYTGVKWVSSKHMPVIHITGYAYSLASPVEFKIGFYIYSDKVIATGVTNMGAWAPDVYLFKYTNADSVDCVAVGLAGSCYFLQLQADVQDEMGKFANILVDRSKWSWSFLTTTGTIPEADGGTTCIAVPYKADILSVAWSKVTGKPTTLSGYGITDAISAVTSTDNAVARFNGTGGAIQNSGVLIDDSNNLSLPLGSSSSFSANPKLIIGNAWLGTNTAGALSYGIISGSAYNSYFAFEGTGLRPANSASAGDNKLNIGTSTVRFKDAYFGGTINTAGADISDSLSIPTDAPSSTTSGKIYLYASSLGEYAVEPWYGFNQLISNGNMESTTGWGTVYSGYTRTVENNVLTLTITSATYRPQVRTALSVTNGHWVYYTYTMKYTTSAAYSDVKTAFLYPTPQYIPTGNQKDADYYNWKKISGIVKVNAAKTYLYIGRTAASSHTFAVGDTVQIKNVMVCDLTEMFGDENIPTVEQFEAMYPQDYYDYSPIE